MFLQKVLTIAASPKIAQDERNSMALNSVQISKRLDVTGRCYTLGDTIFVILEGEPEITEKYYHAILADPRHDGVVELMSRNVQEREFSDYVMGWDCDVAADDDDGVFLLSEDSLKRSLPQLLSSRLQILIEAFMESAGSQKIREAI